MLEQFEVGVLFSGLDREQEKNTVAKTTGASFKTPIINGAGYIYVGQTQ